ncbi:MAG: integration host factor subunit alpha [Deltaproteobacteria bacterium]|nr:integration host factor subunit alpha [Deltaproteobacteria bacterium]
MTLTKAQVVESFRKRIGLPRGQSVELVESLLEIMKKSLERGEDVLISGFGRFCVKDKQARKGRNPQSGQDMVLRPRRVVTFRCSGVLRERINGQR